MREFSSHDILFDSAWLSDFEALGQAEFVEFDGEIFTYYIPLVVDAVFEFKFFTGKLANYLPFSKRVTFEDRYRACIKRDIFDDKRVFEDFLLLTDAERIKFILRETMLFFDHYLTYEYIESNLMHIVHKLQNQIFEENRELLKGYYEAEE